MVDNASANELLEPAVGQGVVRSMSDVLLGVSTPIEELDDLLLEESDETALLDFISAQSATSSSNTWPLTADDLFQHSAISALVLRRLDTTTWKSLRLTCRSWYNAVSIVAPPVRPASNRIPTEILLGIYNNLGAKDFNAARRTCRAWMMASLNKSLLVVMLSRGGWHSEAQTREDTDTPSHSITACSEEWLLSRRLSRQCALACRWTGNGLSTRPAFVDSTETDFSELAHGYAPQKGRASGGLIFITSICGKYLLVAKDTLIYIYGLESGSLRPLTSIVCPRRVLTMSMNASAGRDAVAALLEGRMGMVCELRYGRPSADSAPVDERVEGDESPPRTRSRSSTGTSDLQDAIDSAELGSFPCIRDSGIDSFSGIEVRSQNQDFNLQGTDDANTHDRNLINHTWNLSLRGPLKNLRVNSKANTPMQNIPIESGTSTFYRHLCSEDDPPRNVSLCPQRRCVAFGCSAGIELHWIDALTGQSLSRWFPLTSPSDHLYFLSPRPGFESAKKLRLISSAAHPNNRPAISRKLFGHPTMSSFWGSFGFETRSRETRSCDHYHAVPLSDGHHVLFIDPSTGRLTLGCDAPLGGPTKLVRKMVLNPPEENIVPRTYTAAADMSSGARIVAVYGDTIMLYSIPPDMLSLSRLEQAAESWDMYGRAFSTAARHPDHWLNWWDEPPAPDPATRSATPPCSPIWPLSISGTQLATLPGVCETAIQTRPDILIWAFTYTSQCKTWRLHNYADPLIRPKHYVDRSGLVHVAYSVDKTGDIMMKDDSSAADDGDAERTEWSVVGLDGHGEGVVKRIPRALAVENDKWVESVHVVGCADAWFERGGDVVTWWEG